MIPYWSCDPLLRLGPLEVRAFGVLAAIAIAVGVWVTVRRARERGLPPGSVRAAAAWVMAGGFLCAHLFAVLAYQSSRLANDPWLLLRVWDGLASFGGLLGALAALALFTRRRRLPLGPYADVLVLGFVPAWIIGRLGCFTAHDHPGLHTTFVLAVQYPDGPRHDLGLYEALFTVVLFGLSEILRRRPLAPGFTAALLGLCYAPVRFGFDFLRSVDVRYLGLTPAQYACVGLFAVCLWATVAVNQMATAPAD